jgi:hypothetical protein
MRKNWKTTGLGIGTILSGIVQFFSGNQAEAIGLIMGGIGLLFSKDYDISGK